MQLNIKPHDLYYFDIYLRELLIEKPANSLRSNGSRTDKPDGYQLKYEISINENGKQNLFEILIITTQHKIMPIEIRSIKIDSPEKEDVHKDMLIIRTREAERKTIEKPMNTFEVEAHISTGVYPIKSTIEFGKYRLSPLEERSEWGWLCKLRFPVEAINKDNSITWATVEAKQVAAFLTLIFGVLIRFRRFSEITEDIAPKINVEDIERPDLRSVKHPFAGELKIPSDFSDLWTHFQSLPQDIGTAFQSSCICFQVAKEIDMTKMGVAYLLFVTAIEVISNKVIERATPGTRFKEFICQSLGCSDEKFRDKLGRIYSKRSDVVHHEGVGIGFIPLNGIASFQVVSGTDLWSLEIIVNAALIGFIKNPEKFFS